MGREGKAKEYVGDSYLKPKIFRRYLPIYKKAISYLPPVEECSTVVDLGCGVGYFAKVFFEMGYLKYIGIDFSQNMIEKSKKQVPSATFILGDLKNEEIYKIIQKHKIFVILETLEHIEKDLDVIKNIPKESLVIFSVPNFDGKFHVRYFKNADEVIKRFENFLEFKDIYINKMKHLEFFLFKSIRK